MKKQGIVSFKELEVQFEGNKFLQVLDVAYLRYKIAIRNFSSDASPLPTDLRIFPELLTQNSIQINEYYLKFFKEVKGEAIFLPDRKLNLNQLLIALSDLRLKCINVSKNDGLFSWEENAIVYYNFERLGNAIDGFKIRCSFKIGGRNERIKDRLHSMFIALLNQLFGPFLEDDSGDNKKKVNNKRTIIYDVAISYASEQRDYASALAEILRAKGISVFFDLFFEGKMWGKDLSEYLMDVYYKQSGFCIMLISKDYASKAWPTHERRSAVARNIKELGEYILPIRFDESEIPGLLPTIKYFNANKKSPKDIADFFIQKMDEQGC